MRYARDLVTDLASPLRGCFLPLLGFCNAPVREERPRCDIASLRDMTSLPAVGRPAANALELAGITSLEKAAEHTEEDILGLHGVGPKAVRILREALAASGLGFRAR